MPTPPNRQVRAQLRDFDRTAALVRGFLAERFGAQTADSICCDARRQYESIIPQMPTIEGARARMLNSFLRITAQEVAAYRAMKGHGLTPAQA